jgi:hypothetical protein
MILLYRQRDETSDACLSGVSYTGAELAPDTLTRWQEELNGDRLGKKGSKLC